MAKVKLIIWRCSYEKCGHEFYGQYHDKQVWYRRMFHKIEKIKCPVCKKLTAIANRVVIREIVIEDDDKEIVE